MFRLDTANGVGEKSLLHGGNHFVLTIVQIRIISLLCGGGRAADTAITLFGEITAHVKIAGHSWRTKMNMGFIFR